MVIDHGDNQMDRVKISANSVQSQLEILNKEQNSAELEWTRYLFLI